MAEYYLDLMTMIAALQSLGQTGQVEADLSATPQKGRGRVQPGYLTLTIKDGQVLSWVLMGANGEQILSGSEDDIGTLNRLYPMRIKWKFTQMVLPASSTSGLYSQFSPSLDWENTSRSRETPSTSTSPSHPVFSSDSFGGARVPYRVRVVSAEYLTSMPRQYRMIYALINGINSVERIIQLMPALSPDTIKTILHELQSRGIIVW